jgi:NAD(P)-dependent dehydrogenase (short-subunit alcohol dehydrogenase family)
MEKTLQYQTTSQRAWVPSTSAREHYNNGPKTNYAVIFNMDHSIGALQSNFASNRFATIYKGSCMKLNGKVAVVTGAQKGIGKATAEALAKEGASVVVNFLDDQAAADEIVANIITKGGKAIAVQGDVTKKPQVDAIIERAEEIGGIDILINNAGVFPRKELFEIENDDWDYVHDLNLKACFFCAQAAAAKMIKSNRNGSIVNISSISAYDGPALGIHYAASKGGLISMTRALAMALSKDLIRVNAVAPGLTDTAQPRDGHSEAEILEIGNSLPLGRIIQPYEVAQSVLFLVSDDASQITGQVLHVNSGALMV